MCVTINRLTALDVA